MVLLINRLIRGGAEIQFVHLVEQLTATGHEVVVAAIQPSLAFTDRVAATGASVHVVGGERPRGVRTVLRTITLLRQVRPDALVSFLFQSNVLGLVAGPAARVPVVITSLRNERFGSRRRDLLLRALRPLGTVWVPNSERAATSLATRKVLRTGRVEVIPNAIDRSAFDDALARRSELRAGLGWAPHDVVWVCLARLEPHKGHDRLLDAFSAVLSAAPRARLVLVGSGSTEALLRDRAASFGDRVQVLGQRADAAELLAAADGLVLASRYEGMPNCILEAMAARLPVVATDVGGVADLVVDGETGTIVEPGNQRQLADALVALSQDDDRRQQMGVAGADSLARFTPSVVGARWSELIERTCAAPRPRSSRATGSGERISLFLPSLSGGGAQRVLLSFADLLHDRGWDSELIVGSRSGPFAGEAGRAAPVIDLGARSTVLALPGLVRRLHRHRPALLLSTLDHASVVAVLASRLTLGRTRVAVRVANTTSVLAASASGSNRIVYGLARRLFPLADVLLAPSDAAARDLEDWLGLDRGAVHTVPNPIVNDRVLAAARVRPAHPWFAADAPPVVVGLGRFVAHKGFCQLVEAFALGRGSTGARLVLIGEGPQRAELDALVTSLGLEDEVWFAGFDSNPFPFLAHSHVFVSASEVEGLPGAMIQALACGTKVVAVDSPGGAGEVLDFGRHGRLVAADTASLAEGIAAALAEPPGGPGPAACGQFHEVGAVRALERLIIHTLGSSGKPVVSDPARSIPAP